MGHAHVCQCLSGLRRNSPVTITGHRRKSGEQFVDGVLRLSRGLLQLGLRLGHVVAISAFNSDLYLEWLLAVAFIGGIAAPLNYRWSVEEAKLAMEVVRPVLLVTDTDCDCWHTDFQIDSVPSLRWHVFMNSPHKSSVNSLTTDTLKRTGVKPLSFNYSKAPEGAAMICFTSGTTGKPKGVTLSHSSLIVQSLAKIALIGYSEDDVYLHTAPLCHIGGLSSAMAMLMVGGCHVFIPKFEANSAVDAIEQHHVTSLITVPAMMADLISLIRSKDMYRGIKTVEKILNGGGSLSVELITEATKVFPSAKIFSAYGMTEACSSLTFMVLHDPTSDSGIRSSTDHISQGTCVGKPAPHVELTVRSEEDSSNVGRILTRGPHVMLGYWGQVSSSHEEWLDTGDLGWVDDCGNVWLSGRAKDRIKSGGENVYPEEVEAVVLQHPGVSRIVVIGIPDGRLGEKVVACIQLRDSWQWAESISTKKDRCLSTKILHRYCKEMKLTGYKIPKDYKIWRKEFPLTSTGKLRRDEVRREVISQMQLLQSNL